MKEKLKKWTLPVLSAVPVFSLVLFFILRYNTEFMNFWVFKIAGPFEQFTGSACSFVPFSVLEVLAVASIVVSLLYILHSIVVSFKNRNAKIIIKKAAYVLIFWLWVFAAFYWLWNAVYYVPGFLDRSGMEVREYSVQELGRVTDYFASKAAEFSTKVRRNENGLWDESIGECIEKGPDNYKNIEETFPCLQMKSVQVKPFMLSKFHSVLGFTGMYTPYTGEANINVDAPGFLIPSTICHEMTHQRMISSEAECNFVGITACILSDDPVYNYAGYMSGLIHLCNALYPVSSDLWYEIADKNFTREMKIDWDYNNAYWKSFESPVGDAADAAYDQFLKSNGEELGKKSYGACVDLLISYFLDKI